jgi:uncharacterized protein DUF2252
VLDKLTDMVGDQHRIRESKPLIVREAKTVGGRPVTEALARFIRTYLASNSGDRRPLLARYKVLDVVRKAVGIGSVGTRCWVIFLAGNHDEDPLFLQVKEAEASVLAPYTSPSVYATQGQRVVVGQRLIQGAPDIFLGWGEQDGFHFYVRQLRDMKGSADFVPGETDIPSFIEQCGLFGWALALAHAKSGDPAIIAGYAGKSEALDEAIARRSARQPAHTGFASCAGADNRDVAQPLLYSSWRRHQRPVSLHPLGARSSHWYIPQRPSTPRE